MKGFVARYDEFITFWQDISELSKIIDFLQLDIYQCTKVKYAKQF